MKRVPEEKFDDNLLGFDLPRQSPKPSFVLISRGACDQLVSKFFGESLFEPECRLVVELYLASRQTVRDSEFFLGQSLHTDK